MNAEKEALDLGRFAAFCDMKAYASKNPTQRADWLQCAAEARERQMWALESIEPTASEKDLLDIAGWSDYPHAMTLNPGPNVSRRPVSRLAILLALLAAGELVLLWLDWRWWIAGNVVCAVIAAYLWPERDEAKVKS